MTYDWIYAFLGYGIGAVPFGLLLTKAAGYGDIRAIGSGNIGATNVLRTGNKKLALATLLLDGGKGALGILLAFLLAGSLGQGHNADAAMMLAGGGAVLGHMFPVWLRFKGGKGVATTLGVLLALSWPTGLVCCAIWLGTAFAFRYSSLAALTALLCAPEIAWWVTHDERLASLCAGLALFVWIKHRANIKRLAAGQEPKIGKTKMSGGSGTP
jgi:glycerol-3-phosphate acyltransferase PlsY